MKTLIVILILFSSSVFAQDMIPLSKYLKQTNVGKNEAFYIYTRCSAIGYKMMDLSKNNQQLQDRGKKIHNESYHLGSEIRKMILPKETEKQHLTITATTIGSMIDVYTEVSNANYIKTGMYFTDWMIEDLEICSTVLSDK